MRWLLLSLLCVIGAGFSSLMLLFHMLLGSGKRATDIAIGIDQTVNVCFGGAPDETISARIYRNGWQRFERFVNWLFSDPEHCKTAYESELEQAHLPEAYKNTRQTSAKQR